MPLIAKLSTAWPPDRWRDVTVLVAVSGGADSVALLRALNESRSPGDGRLVVAHFNHRLRGAESDADQAFVSELAKQLDLKLVCGAATSDLSAGGGEGVEGTARKARYEFLASAAGQCGARYVAAAHTADDNVETVLFNILRGTGLGGLGGIPRARKLTESATIIRPLLDVTRAEVLDYLQALGQLFRDDSSNRLEDYARNRIRLQLLPFLERDYNPRVREALLRLAQIAGEADEVLEKQIGRVAAEFTRSVAGGLELHTNSLRHSTDFIGRQLLMHLWRQMNWPLQDMSFEKLDELLAFARGDLSSHRNQPGRQMFPGGVTAELEKGILRLTRLTSQPEVPHRGTEAQSG